MDGSESTQKRKLALVFGNLPTAEEVDQFRLLSEEFDITVVTTESLCEYLNQTSRFGNLRCLALPDHEENPTYIPGLEHVLSDFDVVVIKERLGLYAYQAVKAKWKNRFRLAVWVDNLACFPAEDVDQMRTIRAEVTNAADAFIVQSKTARRALLLEGIEEQRIFNFSPWVEKTVKRTKKNRATALSQLGLPEGSIVVGHVGQVEWEEGLLDLVAGAKIAIDQDASIARRLKMVFCGIGSFSNQLRETMIALGVDEHAMFIAPGRDAQDVLLTAADFIYLSSTPARDRVEGEPYRIVSAMTNEIPIIANRTPLVEEYCGKHRIDFCFSSPESVAKAISKAVDAKALVNSIVEKNAATVAKRFTDDKVSKDMRDIFNRLYQQSASIDSSSLDHQVLQVENLVTSKQYLNAIDLIESIFRIDEIPVHHKANLYRLIGDCFAKLSDNDGAKNSYIKSIELDPYSAKAYIGLGTVGLVKQSNDIAVIHFQKAVSLAPDDEMANLGLGLAFQGMEEYDEAHSWVMKSLEVNPENTAALYTLVKIAYERGQFEDAETEIRRYLDRHPHDHNMQYTLGGILFKRGRYSDVSELCEAIVKVDPMDSKVHTLLQQARRELEQAEVSSDA